MAAGGTILSGRDVQIEGWRVTLYFASRNPAMLFFLAVLILGLGVALAWETRSVFSDRQPLTLREELSEPQPDPERVFDLLLHSNKDKDVERPDALELERLIRSSRLRGDQAAVALALLSSLTLPSPSPGAELLMAAHSAAPPAHANRLAGHLLLADLKFEKALVYFRREVREHASVLAAKMAASAALDSNSLALVAQVHGDPEILPLVPRGEQLLLAARLGLWSEVWRLILEEERSGLALIPVSLSALSALVWGLVLLQAGQVRGLASGRFVLMLLGLLAGMLSTLPTLLMVLVQEELQGLSLDRSILGGLRFFIEGVGLREEVMKLLFFLPLLPFVLRRGHKLEMLVVPASVGLGFAVWENIQYFSDHDATIAFPRFLSANFLHICLTGLLGFSLCGAFRHGFWGALRFVGVFVLVVLAHGLYDVFVVLPQFAQFTPMSLFILCFAGLIFLRRVRLHREPITDQLSIAATFTLGLALLGSAAFVLASYAIGFVAAGDAFMLSLIGFFFLAIIIYWQLGEGMSAQEEE